MTTRHRQTQDKPMASSSQRVTLSANKNKNWRANYLRALNIFTPDLATSTRGRHVPSGDASRRVAAQQAAANGRSDTATSRRRPAATGEAARRPASSNNSSNSSRGRSSVSASTSARQSSSRSGSSSRSRWGTSPSDDKASSYVFGLRSHLFRARRLAPRSGDLMAVDRVSAPIEIPTGSSVTSPTAIPSRGDKLSDRRDSGSHRRRGSSNDFQNSNGPKQPMVQLLSWEEPSVMLGNGGWPLESDKRNRSSNNSSNGDGLTIPINGNNSGRSRRSSRSYSGPDGIAEECEDTEEEDLDGFTNTEDEDDIFKMEFDGDSNAGDNVFRGKRASTDRHRENLRPRGFHDFDGDEVDDVVMPLSASFVPPHQMVERGCFSLGLRDELKRKPGVHI
ncbi:hypothetical protein PHYPSEUDO_001831 [Phytophthora pseudosyringae]|uniref:Uncharacterized protein n=1 Tax=Phytophthora pseudosyringae TaxID=221518 RepID=A0A8T1VXZ5_9STRA|nr:hypothetical protein PHYPSEUDO_001831 [Phytophthora pseudosyringae]